MSLLSCISCLIFLLLSVLIRGPSFPFLCLAWRLSRSWLFCVWQNFISLTWNLSDFCCLWIVCLCSLLRRCMLCRRQVLSTLCFCRTIWGLSLAHHGSLAWL